MLYICEMPLNKQHLIVEERSYQYGYNVDDQQKVPRGPYFVKEPTDVVFDGSRKSFTNDVALRYAYIKKLLLLLIIMGKKIPTKMLIICLFKSENDIIY